MFASEMRKAAEWREFDTGLRYLPDNPDKFLYRGADFCKYGKLSQRHRAASCGGEMRVQKKRLTGCGQASVYSGRKSRG
jgi:hypothetical protein